MLFQEHVALGKIRFCHWLQLSFRVLAVFLLPTLGMARYHNFDFGTILGSNTSVSIIPQVTNNQPQNISELKTILLNTV